MPPDPPIVTVAKAAEAADVPLDALSFLRGYVIGREVGARPELLREPDELRRTCAVLFRVATPRPMP